MACGCAKRPRRSKARETTRVVINVVVIDIIDNKIKAIIRRVLHWGKRCISSERVWNGWVRDGRGIGGRRSRTGSRGWGRWLCRGGSRWWWGMRDVATGGWWGRSNGRCRGRTGGRGVSRALRDHWCRWGYSGDEWTVRRYSCACTRETSCVDAAVGGCMLIGAMVEAYVGARSLLPE